jgi:uncharacterized membrane protein
MTEPDVARQRAQSDAPPVASKTTDPDIALFAEAVTINRPASELFSYWRDPANLVAIMDNIVSIERIDDTRSRWTVKAPGGTQVSWESILTKIVPDEEIYWQSAPDAEVVNKGRIEFREAGARGTIVRATIAYDPPAGSLGQMVAKLFQREPRIQARRDLHRFKQLMETGEIATSARNSRLQADRHEEDQ